MSCVAELNASSQKKTIVHWKKCGAGIISATPAKPAPRNSCIVQIHSRRVLSNIHHRAPQRFDDPRQIKQAGEKRRGFVRHAEVVVKHHRHRCDQRIGHSFGKINRGNPKPRAAGTGFCVGHPRLSNRLRAAGAKIFRLALWPAPCVESGDDRRISQRNGHFDRRAVRFGAAQTAVLPHAGFLSFGARRIHHFFRPAAGLVECQRNFFVRG